MRFPAIAAEQRTPDQQAFVTACTTGWRQTVGGEGRLGGPFDAELYTPALGLRLSAVSDYFRRDCVLAPRLRELAILVVARECRSSFEWYSHVALAAEAGLSRDVIASLLVGEFGLLGESERLVARIAGLLVRRQAIVDSMFDLAVKILGRSALVELVALCGYYSMVAMLLSVSDVHGPGADRADPSQWTIP